jgi:uncharacterized protein (TIGR02444 family)
MTEQPAAESFWRFSLMVYSRPGTADALIGLQDRGGYDVNLILFALWLGLCCATTLDAARLRRAESEIAGLSRRVVLPLRRLRRQLERASGSDIRDLRRRVLAVELAAERRVQARLATLSHPPDPAGGDGKTIADANLRLVLGTDFTSDEASRVRAAVNLPAA